MTPCNLPSRPKGENGTYAQGGNQAKQILGSMGYAVGVLLNTSLVRPGCKLSIQKYI